MYLKRLDMLGFKSFAARTGLEFSSGITAVVGPNGAGKSNVVDAMRWVLGEQSMRQLRGKKSEDIIFAGASGKPALGMAEVSLTLDNSTGWIPSLYSEITVTRRSYRSGENEYIINKQKTRLKDVLLLLAQARIGADSYTVVGQGLVDAALSLRPEERRGLFEDAAGIRPFQVQRLDAESRLKQTEQNLVRLLDIVAEIEPRMLPLKEQAQRAVEYRQLESELRAALLSWYALQWRRLHVNKERAEGAEHEQAGKVRQLEQVIHAATAQGDTLHTARLDLHARIADARSRWSESNQRAQALERQLAVSEERLTGLTRQRGEQHQEERRLRERLVAAEQQTIDLEERCDNADEAVDTAVAALAGLESQVERARQDYDLQERRLRGAQNDLVQVQARLGASQADLGRQQKHLGERNRALASRREASASAQQSLRTLETRMHAERGRLDTLRGEEQEVARSKQSLARTIGEAQQEVERLKSAVAEAERQRRVLTDRLSMLNNWRQNLTGYSDGVRALLRAPADKVAGILAPLPQLAVAPTGLEAALEAALGPSMQAVVTQTRAAAHTCWRYLQTTKAGKAMIVWLEDGSARSCEDSQLQTQEAALERLLAAAPSLREGVLDLAARQLHCEPRYLPLFQRILRGIIIVKDMDVALELLSLRASSTLPLAPDLPFERVVTLQGEVAHIDGWLVCGGKDDGHQGILAYERELRELPQQLDRQVAQLDQLNSRISEFQRAQEGRRAEQAALERELQKLGAQIQELNRNLLTTQREQQRTQAEVRLAAAVEQQFAAEIIGLEQEIVAAQQRVQVHEQTQRELAARVEELQYHVEEQAVAYRRQQDELGRSRTALAVKRHEAKSLRQQLSTQQALAQELKAQLEQQLTRSKAAEQQHAALQVTIGQQRQELEAAHAQTQSASAALHAVEQQVQALEQELAALEKRTTQARVTLSEAEREYRRYLLESQKARDSVETLLAQLREETEDMDLEQVSAYALAQSGETQVTTAAALTEEEEAQLRKVRRRVDALRASLKALGGCDPDAPQQYEETRTRYEFLSAQMADMQQAAQHLRSILEQLDITMARQFETTFQVVNTRFREYFTTLFNGGSARLELTAAKEGDEHGSMPSPMAAGVEVIVQPPGKKAQELSLLSGGERALVSAALLFALLETNPPPFCLLDEVDAALDESNVARFCDILKQLAQRIQFIVITHNRVTMTVAQVIYGISMGADSVSRLLSMKLEEAPVGGDR